MSKGHPTLVTGSLLLFLLISLSHFDNFIVPETIIIKCIELIWEIGMIYKLEAHKTFFLLQKNAILHFGKLFCLVRHSVFRGINM